MDTCQKNNTGNGFLTVIVIYILLAIILNSRLVF